MSHIIKEFNTIAEDLLRQTTCFLGTTYLSKFKTVIIFNSSVPINKYISGFLPYKTYIMNKDTEFFMNTDVSNNKYYNDMIDLKGIFSTIDDESKDNIWEILQALLILAETYYNNRNNKNR